MCLEFGLIAIAPSFAPATACSAAYGRIPTGNLPRPDFSAEAEADALVDHVAAPSSDSHIR